MLIVKVKERNAIPTIIEDLGERHPDYLPHLVEAVSRKWAGVLIVAAQHKGKAELTANVAENFRQILGADTLIRAVAPLVKGKPSGKASSAHVSGDEPKGIPAALKEVAKLIIQ